MVHAAVVIRVFLCVRGLGRTWSRRASTRSKEDDDETSHARSIGEARTALARPLLHSSTEASWLHKLLHCDFLRDTIRMPCARERANTRSSRCS
jgi:hypothetical protein